MASWRLAKSLEVLRDEVNSMAPNRSKASDGTIGDPAHVARASRHNPNDAGVVCAIDITHDPANGCDIHALARSLVTNPHPNLEYVISNGEVAKRRTGFVWEAYTGSNKHNKHVHFAVGVGKDAEPGQPYDDTTSWGVGSSVAAGSSSQAQAGKAPAFPGTCKQGDKGAGVKAVQQRLKDLGVAIGVDGSFGPKTAQAVKGFQGKKGLKADGVVGPKTWAALWS